MPGKIDCKKRRLIKKGNGILDPQILLDFQKEMSTLVIKKKLVSRNVWVKGYHLLIYKYNSWCKRKGSNGW